MAKVECTYGPAETEVAGVTYTFQPDEKGRYVATVHNEDHVAILLEVVHYRRLDDAKPAAPAEKPKPPERPTQAKQQQPAPIGLGGQNPPPQEPPPATEPTDPGTDPGEPGATPTFDDDLTRIKGVGDSLKARLHEDAGIVSLREIAALTPEQVKVLDDKLKLHGRIARDKWVEQAQAFLPTETAE